MGGSGADLMKSETTMNKKTFETSDFNGFVSSSFRRSARRQQQPVLFCCSDTKLPVLGNTAPPWGGLACLSCVPRDILERDKGDNDLPELPRKSDLSRFGCDCVLYSLAHPFSHSNTTGPQLHKVCSYDARKDALPVYNVFMPVWCSLLYKNVV